MATPDQLKIEADRRIVIKTKARGTVATRQTKLVEYKTKDETT